MPYIKGGGQQRQSTNPAVQDIYHSSNVYINNVASGMWLEPGESAAFAFSVPSPADPTIDDAAVQAAISTPSVAMPAYAVTENAIEANYSGGSPTDLTTSTGELSTPLAGSSIPAFLAARLDESQRGMWGRVNPPAPAATTGPGNSNILRIWSELGLPFTTDQPAWCAGFVNWTLKQCGYVWCKEASAAAFTNNPQRWNLTSVPANQAQPGDIAHWNYNGQNHVNFVYTVEGGRCTFVGGNQSMKPGPNNNNPAASTVSQSWPGGWTGGNNWVAFWRPSQVIPVSTASSSTVVISGP
jgi:hypothetical protein